MSDKLEYTRVEQNAFHKVPVEQRQSWGNIALIWIGAFICVPALMIGGLLASGLSVSNMILAAFIGYSVTSLFMVPLGIIGSDLGLPTVITSRSAFGKEGSQTLISIVIAIVFMGWFGFQTSVCGSAFSSLFSTATGINIPVWVSSLIWGIIMVVTAIYGINALKYLNYVAIPSLLIVCLYGVFTAFSRYGMEMVTNHQPSQPFSFLQGVAITVGSFAITAVVAGDYTRYAKNRGDVVKSVVFGVIPVGVAMLTLGGIMSLVAGTYDITVVLTELGVPSFGMIALILATWTTNAVNSYSSGLALTSLLRWQDSKRSIATAIAGGIGTLAAVFGIINYFVQFLNVLGATIPPVAGVMIADYFVKVKGNPEKWEVKHKVNYVGILSWAAGIAASLLIKEGIQAINGIVASLISYIIVTNFVKSEKSKAEAENTEEPIKNS